MTIICFWTIIENFIIIRSYHLREREEHAWSKACKDTNACLCCRNARMCPSHLEAAGGARNDTGLAGFCHVLQGVFRLPKYTWKGIRHRSHQAATSRHQPVAHWWAGVRATGQRNIEVSHVIRLRAGDYSQKDSCKRPENQYDFIPPLFLCRDWQMSSLHITDSYLHCCAPPNVKSKMLKAQFFFWSFIKIRSPSTPPRMMIKLYCS